MTPDIQAAREAAERLRRIHKGECYLSVYGGGTGWMQNDPNDPYNVDMRLGFGLLLAVLADPTVLLKPPEWERASESECWRWHPSPWNYFAGDDYWLVTGPGCTGFVNACDSLSAAQAACEADYRERIRGAFQETKTAPGA